MQYQGPSRRVRRQVVEHDVRDMVDRRVGEARTGGIGRRVLRGLICVVQGVLGAARVKQKNGRCGGSM